MYLYDFYDRLFVKNINYIYTLLCLYNIIYGICLRKLFYVMMVISNKTKKGLAKGSIPSTTESILTFKIP